MQETTLLERYLGIRKVCIRRCPTLADNGRTDPNSAKVAVLTTFSFLARTPSRGLVLSLTNYAWLDSPTIKVCSWDSLKTRLRCPRKGRLFISFCFSKKVAF